MAPQGGGRWIGGFNRNTRGSSGVNSVSFGNYSGVYNNDSAGYGGGYGNIPHGVNQFGFTINRGRGRGRGNYQGSNRYNYNNNPEWYGNNSSGSGGVFDDGNFSVDEDYVYSHEMLNPFQNNSGEGGGRYDRLNSRLKWGGGPRKEIFKKKWQHKKKEVVKSVAVQQEGQASKKKKKKNKGKNVHSDERVARYKQSMTLKNKYRSVKQNRHLTPDDQLVLVMLKKIAQESWQGEDAEVYSVNFGKFASRHPNALILFTYECKKQLDLKYPGDGNDKMEYLVETKKYIVDGFKKVFKQRAASEDMNVKEKLLDTYISKLSGETFTEEDIPVSEDYLFDQNPNKSEEVFINEFKYDFIFNCLECFKFKSDELKIPSKDIGIRLQYHLDCQTIPFLIVESMRAKKLITSVPKPLSDYIFQQSLVHQEKNEECLNAVVAMMVKKNRNVMTPITKLVDMNAVGTDLIRDLADCILLFDRFVTYVKFRTLEFSPHILIPQEQKEKIFKHLVDTIYHEVLEILRKNELMTTKKFPEMKNYDDFDEVKLESVDMKNEIVE